MYVAENILVTHLEGHGKELYPAVIEKKERGQRRGLANNGDPASWV